MNAPALKTLAAALVLVALTIPGPGHAFSSRRWGQPGFLDPLLNPHDIISTPPLQAAGYRCEALTTVLDANLSLDSPPLDMNLPYHFNRPPTGMFPAGVDDELQASAALVNETAQILKNGVDNIVMLAGTSDAYSALWQLGSMLHVIQDFYSHSNWFLMSEQDLGRAEDAFLFGEDSYPGGGLLLAAYSGGWWDGACFQDDFAHGPLCPLGSYSPSSVCAKNNDCVAAAMYGPSRSRAEWATRIFLMRVRNTILAHSRYDRPSAEIYQRMLEFGCDEPQHDPPDEDDLPGDVVTSVDPNEIIGPAGGGSRRAISPDQPWDYEIHFENLPTAGAAANDVEVRNPVDPTRFDAATARMQFVFVGTRPIMLDCPVSQLDTLIDLRPGRPCLLRITGRVSASGDSLVWLFASVDPATGLPPEDVEGGFLPANRFSPEGEGGLAYRIEPKRELADGTVVSNEAVIVFDGQASIATGAWKNLTDRTPPSLRSLEATPAADSTALLRWAGADAASGVMDCDLYAVTPAGGIQLVAQGVSSDSVLIGIRPGVRTGFIAVVRDSAGNRRILPDAADAWAQWTAPEGGRPGISSLLTYPSPATLSFTAAFRLGERSDVDFGLYDVAGRRVWRKTAPGLEPGLQSVSLAPGPSVRPGVYWLRVSTPAGRMQSRIVLLQ